MARRFEGVIFDMDGTLIESPLDFRAIRNELGVPAHAGILESINAMPPTERSRSHEILLRRELAAAVEADLIQDAAETVDAVRLAGLKTALLTRNARQVVRLILEQFSALRFDLVWSREDGPVKPQPDGVLGTCRKLGIAPKRTVCVGDFRYDIEAANAAGAVSVLLAPGELPAFAGEADHVISRLSELPALLGL
jgi:HAD superfamily hydrolase (TIGR01509 family)